MPLKVAVVESDEILRLGIVSALTTDRDIEVVHAGPAADGGALDVIVAGDRALPTLEGEDLPVVAICEPSVPPARPNGMRVLAALPRRGLTAERLLASVHAVAAGLRVDLDPFQQEDARILDPRRIEVLRLLADGEDTRSIARELGASERTVKALVHDITVKLGVRNRAQAVAEGMHLGLI